MKGWALITGASSGIGFELAGIIAANHYHLVLVARRAAPLQKLAAELTTRHGIQVKVLVKDLSLAAAPLEIFEELKSTPVAVLVNNAGFGWYGAFADESPEDALAMMRVNMSALVELTRRFLPPMLARKEGRILNVASTAAFQPGPFSAIYFATKSFVVSFTYALADELSGTGVTVTALCPGGTRTEFFVRAGGEGHVTSRLPMMDTRQVAEAGYRGLMRGRRIVIPGALNRFTATFARWLPIWLVATIARRINKA